MFGITQPPASGTQPPASGTQPPTFVLCGTVLSQHLQPVPKPATGPPDGWAWRCFLVYRGNFLKISVSKQKLRIIYCSHMWWIWFYTELNFLLLIPQCRSSSFWACLPGFPSTLCPLIWRVSSQSKQVVPSSVVLNSLVHNLQDIFNICVPHTIIHYFNIKLAFVLYRL